MSNLFSRWLPCVTLLMWSGILLYFYFSGRIVNALHPSFRPGVMLAGLVLLALAAVFIISPATADGCGDDCSQPLARLKIGKILTFAILILPVAGATVVTPGSFSANTINNRGIVLELKGTSSREKALPSASGNPVEPPLPTKSGEQVAAAESPDQFIPKSPEGGLAPEVIDLLYAAQDASLRKDFENKTVELIGQIMPDAVSNASGHRFKLVRMFMVCCAADARPVAALIDAKDKVAMPDMTWIKVVGKATFPVESGRKIAVVQAESVVATDPPAETMLY